MEPSFGHDFSRVRVHADGRAAESAKAVEALAYTVGNHIVFGQDGYAPHTGPGRRLLAHELAHTVQQRPGGATEPASRYLSIGQPGDAAERQADAAAIQVTGQPRGPASSMPHLSPTRAGVMLQRQPAAAASGPAELELSRHIHEAAVRAAQKAHEKGLDKLPDHVPAAPQPRREPEPAKAPQPALHVPPENLRPDPRDRAAVQPATTIPGTPTEMIPAAPQPAAAAPKPDPGVREVQVASGIAAQSGPAQAGVVLQAALQGKNWVPGKVIDFLDYFHLQLGVLQPTLTLQLTHLRPVQPGGGSAAQPLPPPDAAQLGGTIAPASLKVGDFTITPQIGIAGALAGDVFGKTKGPGRSGRHEQALGVINLQIDYKLSERASLTAAAGAQGGLDVGPQGAQGVGNATGSVVATFHF
jgi:hypothetical protein